MNNIMTNMLDLDIFCADIIEMAKEHYEKNPSKSGNKTPRERVEYWVENYLTPAIEYAIENTFEE